MEFVHNTTGYETGQDNKSSNSRRSGNTKTDKTVDKSHLICTDRSIYVTVNRLTDTLRH